MPYEIDFLAVGDKGDSGDAIALRFTHPVSDGWVHVVIDAGFDDDGDALVSHIQRHYGTDVIDLAILTHPDRDHIGGMGKVVRGLTVRKLWLHDISGHGGTSLPAGPAVRDLIGVAQERGTVVQEAWAGAQEFGGALTVLGPDKDYYDELVHEQVHGPTALAAARTVVVAAARGAWDRIADTLDDEVPFPEKEVVPRNNSSMITLLNVDGRTLLFTADAGVPALDRAWNVAEERGLARPPDLVQVPHHGSRRNASSAWLDRLLGPTGQEQVREATVSAVRDSEKHPSGRVVNAYKRRGCNVFVTAGRTLCHPHDVPSRDGWSSATPLDAMIEEDED